MAQQKATGLVASIVEGHERERPESSVQRVARHLRSHLIEGDLKPGMRLSEEALSAALSVSRSTLREAFRILTFEGLLVHEMNRGVFVRQLTSDDVASNYQFRIMLESAAARDTSTHTPKRVQKVRQAVAEARAAAEMEDWKEVGSANIHFHREIAALAGIDRLDVLMNQLLAEMRLAQHVMRSTRDYHAPYLADNERICVLIESGRGAAAAETITEYLTRACAQLVRAVSESFDA